MLVVKRMIQNTSHWTHFMFLKPISMSNQSQEENIWATHYFMTFLSNEQEIGMQTWIDQVPLANKISVTFNESKPP